MAGSRRERALNALRGGYANLGVMVRSQKLERRLRSLARKVPAIASREIERAVAEWHREAVEGIPVRTGRLKARTVPFVEWNGPELRGGIRAMVPYAIWLAAGTGPHRIVPRRTEALSWIDPETGRRILASEVWVNGIANGRVLHWRAGQPTIKSWRYKKHGRNPRAELPIILPQRNAAAKRFMDGVLRELSRG